jgi:hypothetical protein
MNGCRLFRRKILFLSVKQFYSLIVLLFIYGTIAKIFFKILLLALSRVDLAFTEAHIRFAVLFTDNLFRVSRVQLDLWNFFSIQFYLSNWFIEFAN